MIDHMDIESTCIHKDSEEAQLQLQMDSSATGNIFNAKSSATNTFCCSLNEEVIFCK